MANKLLFWQESRALQLGRLRILQLSIYLTQARFDIPTINQFKLPSQILEQDDLARQITKMAWERLEASVLEMDQRCQTRRDSMDLLDGKV
jgi:hypothetical protein